MNHNSYRNNNKTEQQIHEDTTEKFFFLENFSDIVF